jgi:tetratricopeptide (TPR) repeat protein
MPSANPIQLSLQAHQRFFLSNLGLVEESEEISRACLSRLQKASRPIEESLCLHNLGLNACFRGEYDLSINRLEQAIETGRARRTVAWRSYFLWLGYVYFMIGEYELGMENLQTSYELFDEIGSLWGKAFALSKMGLAANGLKAYDQAMRYYEEARAIFETTGVRAGKGYTLSWMSMGASLKGDFDDAVRFGQVGYETFQEIGHRWGICASLCRLGFANIGLGYIEKAKEQLREALRVAHQHQMTPLIQHALVGMACALAREGEAGRAVELYQFVRNQPATPAIYLDMAARWFPDVGRMPGQEAAETAATALDSESLDSVIEQVLKG